MFEKIKQFYTVVKIKIVFIRDLSPTKKEIIAARAAYLKEIERQFPFTHKHTAPVWTKYALAALAGIFIVNGGAVIYADTTDVPTTHPLYSYKRLAEEVRIKTASVEKQPEVEVKIAQRRIKEIKQLTQTSQKEMVNTFVATSTSLSTSSKKILNEKVADQKTRAALKANLKKNIKAVEFKIERESRNKKNLKNVLVCKELGSIQDDVSTIFSDDDDNEDGVKNIKAKIAQLCNNESSKDRDKNRD